MTPLLFLLASLAGGLGAILRFVVDGEVKRRVPASFPVGTFAVNASGSLILGFLTGWASASLPDVVTVFGVGLMGGYTTFSTASVETVRLVAAGRRTAGAWNGLGMLVVCVACALAGLWLGGLVSP